MTGTVSYVLANNTAVSAVSGVKDMNFDGDGNLVIECNDGKLLTRQFLDIKEIRFEEDDGDKRLIVEYTTGAVADLGVLDPKFDINQLISVGNSADEAIATTPLFINIDNEYGSGVGSDNVADSDDLDDLWKE